MNNPSAVIALALLPLTAACSPEQNSAPLVQKPMRPPAAANAQAQPFEGFTLIAPLSSKRVYLVDMAGESVHHWETDSKPGAGTYLTSRGTLLKCQRKIDHPIFEDAGGHGGWIQEIGPDGEILWDFQWDSESGLQHHDLEELPNGNVIFIAWDRTTRAAALAAGRDPELLAGEEWWPCAVYEVQPTRPSGGEIVWSWHSMDHLVQSYDRDLPNFGDPSARPERIDINGDRDPTPPDEETRKKESAQMAAIGYAGGGGDADADGSPDEEKEPKDAVAEARKARTKDADWMHSNAIDYNAALDQIVLSVRRFDEIWIIDHGITTEQAKGPKGDLLYRWGNPFAYGMGEWSTRRLHGQHHVQWIPEGQLGAGNLICFDNGADPREWSQVVEWWAPRDMNGRYPRPDGQPWGPVQPDWVYEAPEPKSFFSPFISGVQRLPNGNTLICSGAPGHVFEVNAAGDVVWDWRSPFTLTEKDEPDDLVEKHPTALFRAERFAPDHPGIVALRAAGASIPMSAGKGPATNQFVPPAPEDESSADEPSAPQK